MGKHCHFTEEEKLFMREHRKGIMNRDLTDMLNSRFQKSYTVAQVAGWCYSNGLRNGIDSRLDGLQGKATRFQKGHVPGTKGLTRDEMGLSRETQERMIANQFHKGHSPHNRLPVGAVVRKSNGYLWKKTAEPDEWEQLHRLIWKEHNGEIPEGMMIAFIDGDISNLDISNLIMLSMEENGRRRRFGVPMDGESGRAIALLAKIETAAGRIERRRGKRDGE